jgi:hypothetical protein
LAPLIVPVTIRAIAGSEDIIDAMDLRAFGVGPRTWLAQLHARRRDHVLIACGVLLFLASFGALALWLWPALDPCVGAGLGRRVSTAQSGSSTDHITQPPHHKQA